MFGKEPTVILGALSEVVRTIIPMLIIFNFINWTGEQVAQVMIVVSAVVGFLNIAFTRSQVVPTEVANKQIEVALDKPKGTSSVTEVIRETKEEG